MPLFLIQVRGTGKVATFFGPIMAAWFAAMALAALPHIFATPDVFWSLNPYYAVHYLLGTAPAPWCARRGVSWR